MQSPLQRPLVTKIRALLTPQEPTFGVIEASLLALYIVIVAIVAAHHEPWLDEAQSWFLVKDCTFKQLFMRRMHYEGAPALWPLILLPFARLGMSFQVLHWIGGVAGILGAYVMLRYAPFPPILRWTLPFTYWLQYQYVIVARPYVCFAVLAFASAHIFTLRRRRPLLLALLCSLAVNLNLHIAGWATGIMVVYLVQLWRERVTLPPNIRRQAVLAAGMFTAAAMLSAAVAFPSADNSLMVYSPTTQKFLGKFVPPDPIPPGRTMTPPFVEEPHPKDHWFYRGIVGNMVRHTVYWSRRQIPHVVFAAGLLMFPFSRIGLVGLAFLALLIAWLWTRRAVLHGLPLAIILFLYITIWGFEHHAGVFFIALVTAVWIVIKSTKTVRGRAWIQPAFLALFVCIAAEQLVWSASADIGDIRGDFDPSLTTTRYLDAHYAGKKMAAFNFYTVSMGLYKDHPFINWQTRYWPWSLALDPDRQSNYALALHPDVIVLGYATVGNSYFGNQIITTAKPWTVIEKDRAPYLKARGWVVTHQFCGDHFDHATATLHVCYDLYEPPGTLAARR